MELSGFDIAALVILGVIGLRGLAKGFVREFLSKASYLVGLLTALMFAGLAAEYIDEWLGIGNWSNIVAFIILFAAGFGITRIFSLSMRNVLEQLHLTFLDNVLGFVLGVIEGAVIISFIIFLLRLQTLMSVDMIMEESSIAALLEPIAPYSIQLVKGNLQ
ncbi:MAG: CvpA family protein [Spirochaetia bacterium]|nr:CvpA family protein [Spirochaetia bacterium]MCF7946577.1 CvpA family protein [Spirochaetia bacterium]MCF7952921.1 CvpA family protein [Spirochaetales bacterium]